MHYLLKILQLILTNICLLKKPMKPLLKLRKEQQQNSERPFTFTSNKLADLLLELLLEKLNKKFKKEKKEIMFLYYKQ